MLDEEETSDGYNTYSFDCRKYNVTTCIKFKGLEADAIIMLDLNKNSFTGKKGLEFYVETSRAKIRLDLVCNIASADYKDIVRELDPNAPLKNDDAKMRVILGNTLSVDIGVD